MKKTMSLLIIAAMVLIAAGCNNGDDPAPAPPEPVVIPTEVVQPGAMRVSELLRIVNTFLEFDEGWELDVAWAEILDDERYNERLFVLNYGAFEVVLFADLDTDGFMYGYLRAMIREESALIEVASVASAFVMALEPNASGRMLVEVLHIPDLTEYELEHEEGCDCHLHEFDVLTGYGELWAVEFSDARLFNIFPIAFSQN